MTLVKFIQAVEAAGLICLLQTHTHAGQTYAGIMISTKPNPDADKWSDRASLAVTWVPLNGGSVQDPDDAFGKIEKHCAEQVTANAA
jgi:hypothetical protein